MDPNKKAHQGLAPLAKGKGQGILGKHKTLDNKDPTAARHYWENMTPTQEVCTHQIHIRKE